MKVQNAVSRETKHIAMAPVIKAVTSRGKHAGTEDLSVTNDEHEVKPFTERRPDNGSQEVNSNLANSETKRARSASGNSMVTPSNTRNQFIFKVYALITVKLVCAALVAGAVYANPPVRSFVRRRPALVLSILILAIVLMVCTYSTRSLLRARPRGEIIAGIFTLVLSYPVAYVCAYVSDAAIVAFASMSLAMTIGLLLYAWRAKRQLTTCSGLLIVISIALALFGASVSLFPEQLLTLLYCLVGVLILGVYIVVNTQWIASGRFEELTYDDYTVAVLMLYVDLVGVFCCSLRVLADRFCK